MYLLVPRSALLILLSSQIVHSSSSMKTARSGITEWSKERIADRQQLPTAVRSSLPPVVANEITNDLTYPKGPWSNNQDGEEFHFFRQSDNLQALPYPTYSTPPQTSFSCSRVRKTGFYADTETGCQVIRRCTHYNYMFTYICPNRTIFNQMSQSCDYWYNVQCPRSLQQLDDSPPQSRDQPAESTDHSIRLPHTISIIDKSVPVFIAPTSADNINPNFEIAFSDSPNDITHPEAKQVPISQPQVSQTSQIKTLMQWVGENPIWEPTAEQLRFMNNKHAPVTSAPPLPVTTMERKSLAVVGGSSERDSLMQMFKDFDERMNREQILFMMHNAGLDATTMQPVFVAAQQPFMQQAAAPFTVPQNQPGQGVFGPLKDKVLGTPWIPLNNFG